MKRSFLSNNRWLETPRHWPDTTAQSPENPLQEERLPDTSGIELEYAAIQYTPKENWHFTLKQFLIAAVLGIQFFVYEHFFFFAFVWIHSLLAVVIVAFFLFAASSKTRVFWL